MMIMHIITTVRMIIITLTPLMLIIITKTQQQPVIAEVLVSGVQSLA